MLGLITANGDWVVFNLNQHKLCIFQKFAFQFQVNFDDFMQFDVV